MITKDDEDDRPGDGIRPTESELKGAESDALLGAHLSFSHLLMSRRSA